MQLLKEDYLKERAIQFFTDNVHVLKDVQLENLMKEQKVIFKTADYYFRKEVSQGTGIVEMVASGDSSLPGRSNLDDGGKTIYPSAITWISLKYGFDASATEPEDIRYTHHIWSINNVAADADVTGWGVPNQFIPTNFLNGEFHFGYEGTELLGMRGSEFFADGMSTDLIGANDENKRILTMPLIIPGKKRMSFKWKFGDNMAALAAGNHFIEVAYGGVYASERSNA